MIEAVHVGTGELDEIVKEANKVRLANKNKWYVVTGSYEGEEFAFKAFGTWIQRLAYKGFTDSGPVDCTVTEFKQYLLKTLGN